MMVGPFWVQGPQGRTWDLHVNRKHLSTQIVCPEGVCWSRGEVLADLGLYTSPSSLQPFSDVRTSHPAVFPCYSWYLQRLGKVNGRQRSEQMEKYLVKSTQVRSGWGRGTGPLRWSSMGQPFTVPSLPWGQLKTSKAKMTFSDAQALVLSTTENPSNTQLNV